MLVQGPDGHVAPPDRDVPDDWDPHVRMCLEAE